MNLRLSLRHARKYADRIVLELAPFCSRIEVAGSVRRGRATVGDIDLVAIASDMAGLRDRLRRHCIQECVGDENVRVVTPIGVQVDVFLAQAPGKDLAGPTPGTWGSVMLCRTGSVEHNKWFVQQARRKGLSWRVQLGLYDEEGNRVAGETEQDMFAAAGLRFVAPEKREQ